MGRRSKWTVGAGLVWMLLGCQGSEIKGGTYQELLDSGVKAGLVGVALSVNGPGTYFEGAAGYADREKKVAWRTDHLFRIASNSKTFLGVVVAQLAEEGLLDLDAPLADYLSAELINRIENVESATIRQALNHTSGIFDYLETDGFTDACQADPSHRWSPEEALVYAYDEPAYFTAGEDWEYSNSNYLLVGLVVDAVVGHPHSVEIRNRILNPLSLNATFYEHQEEIEGEIVHGYAVPEGGSALFDYYAFDQGYGLADGGMVATTADLARFIAAVGAGTALLSPEARGLMFGQMVPLEDNEEYGLGVSLQETPYGTATGHGGGVDGYTSDMLYFSERDTSIVLFTNGSDDEHEEAFEALLEAVQALTFDQK